MLRRPKENRTDKSSTCHDEEHAEPKYHTHANIHSTTTPCLFLPVPRSTKRITTEINRYIQRNTKQNRGNKEQRKYDPPVMQETTASKEEKKNHALLNNCRVFPDSCTAVVASATSTR